MSKKRIYVHTPQRAAAAATRYHRDIEVSRARSRDAAEKHRRQRGQMTMAEYRAKMAKDAAERKKSHQADIEARRAQKRRDTLARQAALKAERTARQREQQRLWRGANRDKARALQKAWRDRNREKRRNDKRARSTAKRATLVRDLTKLQRGRCAYCRVKLGTTFHVDHIMPLKLGGADRRSNLQLACETCNLTKNAQHPVAFAQSLGLLL
jgi:5-methylcytosine-specific restriction endonuclease McrA